MLERMMGILPTTGALAALGMLAALVSGGAPACAAVTPEHPGHGRLTRTYTQHLGAPPGEIFPLLGPVGEKKWGGAAWNPRFIYPVAGADETGCVFATGGPDHETIWMLVEFEAARSVRYIQVTPGVKATDLSITLSPEGPGGTAAGIRYTWTALSSEGDAFLAVHAGAHFDEAMADWESAINDYLKSVKGH